ncbi:Peroxiredoxin [Caloranaerobacter azorensis DSM 13643]|uniref:Peroxiredoxin n=1 Tax=Caloranaerobacter azorensis DSM 13643 TaxID=1121264 RepID=A0A1M5UF80_9FIRM|nr:TlpA family protein disulfide reductase [Caloranaerobacter azorensis]SHH61694.1 Peroxiredoxin [Caloranaerobacter azorensis DSM 13643]
MNKRFVIITILVIALAAVLFYASYNTVPKSIKDEGLDEEKIEVEDDRLAEEVLPMQIGSLAPEFVLETLEGKKVSLEDYKGKIVLINFWATWCPYCVREMPYLNKLYLENKDNDFVVLGIDVMESKSEVESFAKKGGYEFPILLDKEGEVARNYLVSGLPMSVMLDKEGRIRAIQMGMMTYSQMKEMLDSVRSK